MIGHRVASSIKSQHQQRRMLVVVAVGLVIISLSSSCSTPPWKIILSVSAFSSNHIQSSYAAHQQHQHHLLLSSTTNNKNNNINRRDNFKSASSTTQLRDSSWRLAYNGGDETAFVSSFLYGGTFQEGMDDGILRYLPDSGTSIPPKTRQLIKRLTSEYVYGSQSMLQQQPQRPRVVPLLSDILDAVETEYDTSLSFSVSLTVGNQTFDEPRIIQLVSLAVLHQLPKEITLALVKTDTNGDIPGLVDFVSAFERGGWDDVAFPRGLGLRMKKRLLRLYTKSNNNNNNNNNSSNNNNNKKKNQQFFPPSKIPWRTRSKRKAAIAAARGVIMAAETRAPTQNIMTKEEFLVEIENEMQIAPLLPIGSSSSGGGGSSSKNDNNNNSEPSDYMGASGNFLAIMDGTLPSFPADYSVAWTRVKRLFMDPSRVLSRNKKLQKVLEFMNSQYARLKAAGRAGIMSYAFINFVLYTVGMAWQWRRIAIPLPVPDGATLVSLTLRKFIKAFRRVYVGAAVFKVVRIVLALTLAPAAGKVLAFTQRKLRVSENTALVILITLLLKTFLGTLTIVFLGDTALRKALVPIVAGSSPIAIE